MYAQEWTRFGGTTNAPSATEEAELLELGRRVAQERGYQSVLFDDPAGAAGPAGRRRGPWRTTHLGPPLPPAPADPPDQEGGAR